MSDNLINKVCLIGAGYMAVEYAKVLHGLNRAFVTVGRSGASCARFSQETGLDIVPGGIEAFLMANSAPEEAIVAVNIEELYNVTKALLCIGTKRILLEKPAGMNRKEIEELASLAAERGAEVYIAYNRRFYAATIAAKRLIELDGGVDSFNFEFTEWSHQIVSLNKTDAELSVWFLANSTHVIDLAFYLGGEPDHMQSYAKGSLEWYEPAAVFAGSGVSSSGALFSYQANWRAPGRWGVEVLTQKHRYIFRPLEKLQMQDIGSINVYDAPEVDYAFDSDYKPGLYFQTKAFFDGEKTALLPIDAHLRNLDYYECIEQGGSISPQIPAEE